MSIVIPSWLQYYSTSNGLIQTYIYGFLDISGNLIVRNSNIQIVNGDLSLNGNVYVNKGFTQNNINTGNITATNNLFQINSNNNTIVNGNLFLGNTLVNGNLFVINSNINGNSFTMNGNLLIKGNVNLVNANLYIGNAPNPFLLTASSTTTNFGGLHKPALYGNSNVCGYLAGNAVTGYGNLIFSNDLIGAKAMQYHNAGNVVAFGYNTLNMYGNAIFTKDSGLTAIGINAGSVFGDSSAVGILQNGICNTYIGANTGHDSYLNTWNYSTAIGAGALITANNQIVLGTSNSVINFVNRLGINNIGTTFTLGSSLCILSGSAFFKGDISGNIICLSTIANKWGVANTSAGDINLAINRINAGFTHCAEYVGAFSSGSYFAIDSSFASADPSNVLYFPNCILYAVYVQSKTNVTSNTTINVTQNNSNTINVIIPSGQNKGTNLNSSLLSFNQGDFMNVNFGTTGGGGSVFRVSMLFKYF